MVDGDDWREANGPVADAEVEVASPALLGVKHGARSQRLEAEPRGQLPLAGLVKEADPATLAPAPDAAGHLVVRQLVLDPLLQPIGVTGIEPLVDESLEIVAQRLRHLGVGHTGNLCLLDDVPRVDVVVGIGLT